MSCRRAARNQVRRDLEEGPVARDNDAAMFGIGWISSSGLDDFCAALIDQCSGDKPRV